MALKDAMGNSDFVHMDVTQEVDTNAEYELGASDYICVNCDHQLYWFVELYCELS